MATTVLIKGVPPTLPQDYCPPTWQDLVNKAIGLSQFTFQTEIQNTIFNFGDTTPTPENREFPWYRTVGGYPVRWYKYFAGKWLSFYRVPPGPAETMMWPFSEASLWSYDEGDGVNPSVTAPTLTTGSFWQVDTQYQFRVPVGQGTLPSGLVLNVGDAGGEEKHVQTIAELAAHTHNVANVFNEDTSGGDQKTVGAPGNTTNNGPLILPTDTAGTGVGANVMQPYRVIFFAKRTIRNYWTV